MIITAVLKVSSNGQIGKKPILDCCSLPDTQPREVITELAVIFEICNIPNHCYPVLQLFPLEICLSKIKEHKY